MTNDLDVMASYKVIKEKGGTQYQFCCELCGAAVYTTAVKYGAFPEKELETVWNIEGRKYFNRCQKCGKWVCNAMFNPDVLECVECSPLENPPRYCMHCGTEVPLNDTFCRKCGRQLRYGRLVKDDS